MISHETANAIIRYATVDKWPVGTIASRLLIHHSVVTRVLRQYAIDRSPPARPSKIEPFLPFVIETFEKHPGIPASRVYQMVCERGYEGAPDHFRAVVSKYRPKRPAEAFLRLRTLPGEQAQMDWGDFGLTEVDGAQRRIYVFSMVLSYSRKLFVRFGYSAAIGAFLRAHVQAFEYFGGVPRTILYDNLRSAVLSRVGDAIEFNCKLLALSGHYRFLPKPVAVRRGNEKGRVERSIRYIRSSFFPAREFDGLDDLNAQAMSWMQQVTDQRNCPEGDRQKVWEVFQDEQKHLLALPDNPFPHEEIEVVHVGKTPYVRFDCNDYSIPYDRVRRALTVYATEHTIRIVDGSEAIASHPRCWGRRKQIENPEHIQTLIERKSHAREARNTDRLHHACPSCKKLLETVARQGGRLASTVNGLNGLLDRYGPDKLDKAVNKAIEEQTVNLHAVEKLLEQQLEDPPPVDLNLAAKARELSRPVPTNGLSIYDELAREE
jgi:transposase